MENPTSPSNPVPPVQPSAASAPVTPTGAPYQPPATPPPPSPSPIVPPPPPTKKGIPLFLLLGILLLIIIGAGAYIWFMQKPTQKKEAMPMPTMKPSPTIMPTDTPMASSAAMTLDSANWKTYTSLDGNYTITYPSNTFVRYICPDEELTLEKRMESDKEDTLNMPTCARDGLYDIEIITLKHPFVEQKSDENYSITKETVTVGGLPAQKYVTTLIKEPEGPSVAFSEDIYLPYKGKTYQLHVGQKDLLDVFNQMLSTITFSK